MRRNSRRMRIRIMIGGLCMCLCACGCGCICASMCVFTLVFRTAIFLPLCILTRLAPLHRHQYPRRCHPSSVSSLFFLGGPSRVLLTLAAKVLPSDDATDHCRRCKHALTSRSASPGLEIAEIGLAEDACEGFATK